jgi:hypothetical protein
MDGVNSSLLAFFSFTKYLNFVIFLFNSLTQIIIILPTPMVFLLIKKTCINSKTELYKVITSDPTKPTGQTNTKGVLS